MDEKSKAVIKEVLEYFYDEWLKKFHKHNELKLEYDYSRNISPERKKKIRNLLHTKYKLYDEEHDLQAKQLVKLNELLDIEEQKQELIDLAQQMKKIQAKNYISVKEFTEIYGKSSDWQRDRRGRIKNKLPFMQEKSGSNIMYKVEDIEIWFQNNS